MYQLLIADNELDISKDLCEYFPWEQMGFQIVDCVDNGKAALEVIEHSHIDVVLCDIRMPIMDGIELAKHICQHHQRVRVVFLSSYREFEYAQAAIRYKVFDYILKPTQFDQIIEVFSRLKAELDLRRDPAESKAVVRKDSDGNKSAISVIKQYLENEYATASLEEAAKIVYMNPQYLSKFFKQKTGEGFGEYLHKIKMTKAAEMLRSYHGGKIYEISERVGYTNPKNFSRAFSLFFQMSPKEYRNQHMND